MLIGAPLDGPFLYTADLDASEQLASVMAALVPQQPVLAGVIAATDLNMSWQQLRPRVQAAVQGHSHRLVLVTATAPTAAEAEAIVAAIPRSLAAVAFPPSELSSLLPPSGTASGDGTPTTPRWLARVISRYRSVNHGVSTAHVQVVEPPTLVSGPYPPTAWVIAATAAAGALVAFLAALSVELWRARPRRVTAVPSYAAG